ncbi:hypothetical protein EXE58_10275 [Nocardioides seonyuensis]|uniref:Uncharacterized protein n=1 Tax=Nocardioides seonyuensis TaxID=2518371 RepID=A0A4P7IHX8_9ACTN|nr:hypothetical protein EXE58_10275 [Nocardioides seonyuensis]
MGRVLPRLEIVRRLRPVDLVALHDVRLRVATPGLHHMPAAAPYVAVTSALRGTGAVAFHLGGMRLAAEYDGERVALQLGERRLVSRRHGRAQDPVDLGLSLTGTHVTAWVRERGRWVARAGHDLRHDPRRGPDTHDESALAALAVETTTGLPATAGGFGQLGLRDIRVVTHADGEPVREGGATWLTATSAGPGFFDTGHTSVWRLEPDLTLTHTGDLFFRRPDKPGVFGDHATHLVRDGDHWLVATSTWGDFEAPASRAGRRTPSTLRVTRGTSTSDLLRGTHVLDTVELPLPTDGFASIATWDPHLLRRDGTWHVGFVSAHRFFFFHPALAAGPSLDELTLVGADPSRVATEGTTLLDVDGALVVLASDGRQGRRGQRAAFPVFDPQLREVGALDAPYPTNLPWPSLVREGRGNGDGDSWLMVTFNGRPQGGDLLGYGTHGDVVVMRSGPPRGDVTP